MTSRDELKAEVERFLEISGMSPGRFGLEAVADSSWWPRFCGGGGTTLRTADRVRTYMHEWLDTVGRRRSELLANAMAEAREELR